MKTILFFAPYPNAENIKDGFFQRIKNIDNEFLDYNRIYLKIFFRFGHNKEEIYKSEKLSTYKLHFFKSFSLIKNIIKENKIVYVHSILNFFPGCLFLSKKHLISLDFHGIVPEELKYSNNTRLSFFYSKVEKKAMSMVKNIIVVTKSMEKFINNKYPKNTVNFIYHPIITRNTLIQNNQKENIKDDKIVFVYSGNCQKWQRVDDVLYFIKNHDSDNYKYIILTLDVNIININIKNIIGIEHKSEIIVKSVQPNELFNYYEIADYGFLIRDDHPLNRVANPTKMLEYLYYGLNIIGDLYEIGDYRDYDFLKFNDENLKLRKGKSKKNANLAKNILNQNVEKLVDKVIFND